MWLYQDYAQIGDYNIPKKSIILTKEEWESKKVNFNV